MHTEDYYQIKESLQQNNVKLIAISKTKPVEAIQNYYDIGQRIFGENRAREMQSKHDFLPKDIEWHMVGHMQTNKVKYIAPFVSLIHSIDSLNLLIEVDKRAKQNNRSIDVLLQMHIAKEENKFGFTLEEVKELFDNKRFVALTNIRVRGLMGMATFTNDQDQIRKEFRLLSTYFQDLKTSYFSTQDSFSERSMGMSGDYKIAIEEGSTMVRIGSLLFGKRSYK